MRVLSVAPCYAVAVGSLLRGNGDGGKQVTKGEIAFLRKIISQRKTRIHKNIQERYLQR